MRELEHDAVDGILPRWLGKNRRGIRHGRRLIKRGFGTDRYGALSGVVVDGRGGVAVSNFEATASER